MERKTIPIILVVFGILASLIGFALSIETPNGYIGESGTGWTFNDYDDIKKEVNIWAYEINETVLEITIDNHNFSTTGNNYKWDMALCNMTGSNLKYMEEDAGGGFEFGDWVELPYGKLTDEGMNETWCGQTNGYGFSLFSAGSKNQLPMSFRLFLEDVTNHTIYAGTGTAELISTSEVTGLAGSGDNICRDRLGVYHIGFEGLADDLWYANNTGGTWSAIEILSGTTQHISIICGNENNITIFYADAVGNIAFKQSDNLGANFGSPITALDIPLNPLTRTTCAMNSSEIITCIAYDISNKLIYQSNSQIWDTDRTLGEQNAGNDTDQFDISVGPDGNFYVIGGGATIDDWFIWNGEDTYTTKHLVMLGGGNVNDNIIQGMTGMSININGTIGWSGPLTGDNWICMSNITYWDEGSDGWNCFETATQESRGADTLTTWTGDIYSIFSDDNTILTSDLLMTNTSDDGTTIDLRVNIDLDEARMPSIAGSLYPIYNRPNDTMPYVFGNASGIHFNTQRIPAPKSCTYLGWEVWDIVLEDNCIINGTRDFSTIPVNLIGTEGSLTIEGWLRSLFFNFEPEGGGAAHLSVNSGGSLTWGL